MKNKNLPDWKYDIEFVGGPFDGRTLVLKEWSLDTDKLKIINHQKQAYLYKFGDRLVEIDPEKYHCDLIEEKPHWPKPKGYMVDQCYHYVGIIPTNKRNIHNYNETKA